MKTQTKEFLRGLGIGLLISVGWVFGTSDSWGHDHDVDQFVVLDTRPLIEGTDVLLYTIKDTERGDCYEYVPSTALHEMELRVVLCPTK